MTETRASAETATLQKNFILGLIQMLKGGAYMSVNEMRIQKIFREEEDVKRLGIPVKYMCLSLSCEHHSSLHGKLLSFEEVKEIFGLDKVPGDCRCAVTQVLVDESGEPLAPDIVERVKKQGDV